MSPLGLLHSHPRHRARQIRWVLPAAALLLLAVAAVLIVQFYVSDRAVSTEFFRAHKTISDTGQLLERGTLIGGGLLVLLVAGIALWALRHAHRIVRPVHTIHRTLDALETGDLGVRVQLQREDEFREVGDALNRLIDRFAGTLGTVHGLVDRIGVLTDDGARDPSAASQIRALVVELDHTMDFFRLEPRRVIRESDD